MRMMLDLPPRRINTRDFLASLGIPLPPLSQRLLQVVSTVACECPEPCLCGRSTERPPRCPRSPPNASLGRLQASPASPWPAIPRRHDTPFPPMVCECRRLTHGASLWSAVSLRCVELWDSVCGLLQFGPRWGLSSV